MRATADTIEKSNKKIDSSGDQMYLTIVTLMSKSNAREKARKEREKRGYGPEFLKG